MPVINRFNLNKELIRIEREERRISKKHRVEKTGFLNKMLENKIPNRLRSALDSAFAKSFNLVFDKGTAIIEKSIPRGKIEKQFKIDNYAVNERGGSRDLHSITRKANSSGTLNLIISGISGIGLGILGIGLPDIALFISVLLKNIYEISMHYGFSYKSDDDKRFILMLICASLSYGDSFDKCDSEIDSFIENGQFKISQPVDGLIKIAAETLSEELLYMKFVQGIPLIGAIGGMFNAVYMNRITGYSELKYRKRYYHSL